MVRRKQILVVEDNQLNREILCGILEDADYDILQAENGQEALNLLREHGDNVSLILLDVMMPVMDGYTFLRITKEDPKLSHIPVIVTTQSDTEADEVTALGHGATDFVPKPYRPRVILRLVAALIKLRETAAMVNQLQYDRLTGLYSREYFYQKVRERLLLNPDRTFDLICANLENFKLYNDAFGIAAGDQLLKRVGAAFQEQLRDDALCCRYRADRFFCLMEHQDYQQGAHDHVGENFTLIKGVNMVMKWGIYRIQDLSVPVELMCDRAIFAVESIKGRSNRFYAVYDDTLRTQMQREQTLIDATEEALAQGQFQVYYQPKYSLTESYMVGAEALVRWIHPKLGFLSPGEFIPLFEKNGFIPRLDAYVWEQVCRSLKAWKEQGYDLVPVSVNVSRADVYQGDLAKSMTALVERYGVDPAYLHLEITESAYSENPDAIIQTVAALREHGFVIEMDDFGSGYSSLNMLGQMSLDILKLDMQFVQNEMAKSADVSILGDVVNMAHRAHLTVVAEGVETREQMNRLCAAGCDYAQGYFFAKPMPEQEFLVLLKRWHPAVAPVRPGDHDALLLPHGGLHCALLVVDEDAEYRGKVRGVFEEDYRVAEAWDRDGALDFIRSCREDGIAAVILSMTLPDNAAEDILKAIRQEPKYWEIPVLATIPGGDSATELPLAAETDDFLCKSHPLFDLRRRTLRLMEIASVRRQKHDLRQQASQDYLTGLLNRRGLQTALAAIRKEDMPVALCMFDLDNLKQINDQMGHDMGDRAIRAVARQITAHTRAGDIQCRYGGDEFLVVLKRLEDVTSIAKKGEEMCRFFREHAEQEAGIPLSCSLGIALCGPGEAITSDHIRRADAALYHAKREHKGGCCVWDGTLSHQTE